MISTIQNNSNLRSDVIFITELAAESSRSGNSVCVMEASFLWSICSDVAKTDEYLFGSGIDDIVGVDLIQYYEKHWQTNRAALRAAAERGEDYEVHVDFLTALHKIAWFVFA